METATDPECTNCGRKKEKDKFKCCPGCREVKRRKDRIRCLRGCRICHGSPCDDPRYKTCTRCREKKRNQRQMWEDSGRCAHCGGTREDQRYGWCSSCREKERDRRNSKTKAENVLISTLQLEEPEDEARPKHERTEAQKEKLSNKLKDFRRRQAELGSCTKCGSGTGLEGFKTCADCRRYQRLWLRQKSRRRRQLLTEAATELLGAPQGEANSQETRKNESGLFLEGVGWEEDPEYASQPGDL
jgi:hypothetical protein